MQTRSCVTMSDLTFWTCQFNRFFIYFLTLCTLLQNHFLFLQLPSSMFRTVLLRNDHKALWYIQIGSSFFINNLLKSMEIISFIYIENHLQTFCKNIIIYNSFKIVVYTVQNFVFLWFLVTFFVFVFFAYVELLVCIIL